MISIVIRKSKQKLPTDLLKGLDRPKQDGVRKTDDSIARPSACSPPQRTFWSPRRCSPHVIASTWWAPSARRLRHPSLAGGRRAHPFAGAWLGGVSGAFIRAAAPASIHSPGLHTKSCLSPGHRRSSLCSLPTWVSRPTHPFSTQKAEFL